MHSFKKYLIYRISPGSINVVEFALSSGLSPATWQRNGSRRITMCRMLLPATVNARTNFSVELCESSVELCDTIYYTEVHSVCQNKGGFRKRKN